MTFNVKLYNNVGNLLSDEVWYGDSLDGVKFWIDLALLGLMDKFCCDSLYYTVDPIKER